MDLTQRLNNSSINPEKSNSTEKPPMFIMVMMNPRITNTPTGPIRLCSGWGMVLNPARLKIEGIPIPETLLVEEYSLNAETGVIYSQSYK